VGWKQGRQVTRESRASSHRALQAVARTWDFIPNSVATLLSILSRDVTSSDSRVL